MRALILLSTDVYSNPGCAFFLPSLLQALEHSVMTHILSYSKMPCTLYRDYICSDGNMM